MRKRFQLKLILALAWAFLLTCAAPLLAAGGAGEQALGLIAFCIFVVLMMLANVAFSALITVVKLEHVQRGAALVNTHRATCFWWGLATAFLMWMLTFFFFASSKGEGLGALLGFALIGVTSLALGVGFAGVSLTVGSRLISRAELYHPALIAAAGALVLSFAFLVPIAGQALFFYVMAISLGAFRLTWFGKRHRDDYSKF